MFLYRNRKRAREEFLRSVYEQHWLHARHVENERLWFTNVFAIVIAALLAGLATIFKEGQPLSSSSSTPQSAVLSMMSLVIPALIIVLSVIGCFMMITWRSPFNEHLALAYKMFAKEKGLKEYLPYQNNAYQRLKWILNIKLNIRKNTGEKKDVTIGIKLFSAFTLFYLFFCVLSASGVFLFSFILVRGFHYWQIAPTTVIIILLLIPLAIYERKEREYNDFHYQGKT